MIFKFLKKQKDINKKKELIIAMINSLNIPDNNKTLYLESLDILNIDGLNKLYNGLISFIENFEMKELDDIRKQNFSTLAGLRKKEAVEKQKEMNSFSFLLHNI